MSAELREELLGAPCLHRAIELFCASVDRESTGMSCWLAPERDMLRFYLVKSFGRDTPGYAETEWLGLSSMMAVVRLFVGPQWQPREISLRTPAPVPRLAHELFPNTRILMGRSTVYFTLPRSMLRSTRSSRNRPPSRSMASRPRAASATTDLADSIREIVRTYLPKGCPRIEQVAGSAGTSVRSLQRCLSSAGVSYASLVEEVRMEVASTMLTESGARSIEIARALGYSDASNFARPFRRMTGVSPREYRRQPVEAG